MSDPLYEEDVQQVRAMRQAGKTWFEIGAHYGMSRPWASSHFAEACTDIDGPVRAGEVGALCKRAGITYRQLDHWTRVGVLRPTVHGKGGSGYSRHFTADEVRVILTLQAFSDIFRLAPGGGALTAVLGMIAEVVRHDAEVRWIRLAKGSAVAVEAPLPDGAVYLSVPL